jgi:7,8-dihydropterin-6-yl-methyl-4-(beta-D-ribofuranosyl)aminobenzene 5'-phosphate synthase
MIIKMLVDNTSLSKKFSSEHGLSLYIETEEHKILFDMGASELFAENAEKMNINLKDVDIAIVSHGHYDHGGGLEKFLKINAKAKIYVSKSAFENYYSKDLNGVKKYIGLNKRLSSSERIIFTDKSKTVDKGIYLFSNVKGVSNLPSGNHCLYMEKNGVLIEDDFSHEQNLIIRENGKTVLIAGCAHNGIINIQKTATNLGISKIDYTIGGFHLYSRSFGQSETPEKVIEIGYILKEAGPKFYTCHCTGLESYKILKEIMNDKIDYLSAGSQLVI